MAMLMPSIAAALRKRRTLPRRGGAVTAALNLFALGGMCRVWRRWHLGFKSWSYTPQERGFDSFFGYYGGSTDYYTMDTLCWPDAQCFTDYTPTHEAVSGWDLHRDRQILRNNTEYSTNLFTAEAEKIIAAHAAAGAAAGPLFLYLPYQAVHVGNKPTPMHPEYALDQAPQQYIDEYSWVHDEHRRNLSAMVTVMDEAAGNVTSALKTHGLWPKTLFIFSTDNGGPLSQTASNWPLRGGKATLWEGGVRGIGFVVAGDPVWLGVTTSGSVVTGMMHVSDWLPTVCDPALAACDLSQGGNTLDGVSAWAAIATNATSARREIVHDLRGSGGHSGLSCALRLDRLKIIGNPASWQLYDVVSDPGEADELSNKTAYSASLAHLVARAQYWLNESRNVVDQAGLPPDWRSNPALHGGAWEPWLPDNCTAPDGSDCPPHRPPSPPAPPPPPAPSPSVDCDFVADMDQYPAHTGSDARVASPEACCAACKTAGAAKCNVAVFSSGRCYFKPVNATPRPRSGSMTCKPRQP